MRSTCTTSQLAYRSIHKEPPIPPDQRLILAPLLLALATGLTACAGGAGSAAAASSAVDIRPQSAMIAPSGQVTFSAVVTGAANTTVTWSIQEGSGCGSISPSGVYTAPPTSATCHVVASLENYGEMSSATVRVAEPPRCATEPLRTTGTVFYFCDCGTGADPACVPGNDSNDGLSPARPKRTSPQEKFKSIMAGQTVAMCRGGAFSFIDTYTNNHNCNSATDTCDLRDYTPPSHPEWSTDQNQRPIINGPRVFVPNSWSASPSSRGLRFWNLRAQNLDAPTRGMLFQGSTGVVVTQDVDICNVSMSNAGLGVYFGDGPGWVVRNSQFARLDGQGTLGSCTDCVIDSNYFAPDSYGQRSWFNHAIYIGGNSAGVHYQRFRVTNNEIHGCPAGTPATTGTPLVTSHGFVDDLLFENNLVQCDHPEALPPARNAMVGFETTDGGYDAARPIGFSRAVIRRNRFIGFAVGISISVAPDAVVEDNVVIPMIAAETGNDTVGIQILSNGRTASDVETARVTVRNNTIFAPPTVNGNAIVGIRTALPEFSSWNSSGHNITNNVVYSAVPSKARCFDLAALSYGTLANNACNGTWNTTLDTGRVAVTASPFVNDPADLSPAAGSPLESAGSTATCTVAGVSNQPCSSLLAIDSADAVTWSPTDVAKIRNAVSDIGAIER